MEVSFLEDIVLLENIVARRTPPKELSLLFLKNMTDNFSEEREIGRGGFGVVYKGEFKNRNIALKKLTFSKNAEKDFDREIGSLLMVNHKNIVQFLGYCNNRNGIYQNMANPGEPERISCIYMEERILCFEYISNGSLTDHIHDELRGPEWNIRYKIIKEICEGLDYLHKKRLIHRDLKPDNILVDEFMVPKIADLGISKVLSDGKSKTKTTNNKMSRGYAPPEFLQGVVSFKYDIYSLGVIIIELVTGVRETPDVKNVLTRWRHRWKKSNKTLRYQQVKKCIEIGILCQKKNPIKRPSIERIIKDLNEVDGDNGHISNPNESAFGQVIPCWNDLWIEPPELFFPFQINKQISCSLELHNETDAHLAFFIKTYSEFHYRMEPEKGIIPPSSHFTVDITLLAQEEEPHGGDKFIVKSTRVNEGRTSENILKDLFSKRLGNIVDKTRLCVIFDAKQRAKCMVEEEPKEHMSLEPLEISASQETGQTSSEAQSSTNSLDCRDKSQETGETSFEAGSSMHSLVVREKHGGSKGLFKKAPWDVTKNVLSSWIPFLPVDHVFNLRSKKDKNWYTSSGHVRRFTYSELEIATLNFAEELGEDAFGVMYKGVVMLQGRKNAVVIKKRKLAVSSNEARAQARAAFNNEIDIMSPLNHRNIIRFVGCCDKRDTLLLVYELVGDQNLATWLYGTGASVDALRYGARASDSSLALDWQKRYNILLGIASGLEYLQDKCAKSVLHRDIKPTNVMLDNDFNAKLCGFGLVVQLSHPFTSDRTDNVNGSAEYIDPQYVNSGKINRHSDVYSYGVLLLEVICGARPELIRHANGAVLNTLIEKVRKCHERNAILDAADQLLRGHFDDEIEGALLIGLRCVKEYRVYRPTIHDVLAELVSLVASGRAKARHAQAAARHRT